MRVLIASDIHGSEFFMKKLMERYMQENVEQLILLGDLYYHGPRNSLPEGYNSQKVADILNSISDKILCVRGNCDSEVDEMISKFHFTENLQLYINNKKVFLTHGHKLDEENLANAYDIIIYGHLHTGFIKKVKNTIVANTGSVSLPKNGTTNSYIILNDNKIELKDLAGNLIESEDF